MIEEKTKQKLLKELEKIGNILMSCLKYGIDRSTFYRWKESDPEFKEKAEAAIQHGRENICDIAEHGLVRKLKEADMNAIKYTLSHNSKHYQQKRTSKVILEHRKNVLNTEEEPITVETIFKAFDESEDADMDDLERVIHAVATNDHSLLKRPLSNQEKPESYSEIQSTDPKTQNIP